RATSSKASGSPFWPGGPEHQRQGERDGDGSGDHQHAGVLPPAEGPGMDHGSLGGPIGIVSGGADTPTISAIARLSASGSRTSARFVGSFAMSSSVSAAR